jgi:hypothetical protein
MALHLITTMVVMVNSMNIIMEDNFMIRFVSLIITVKEEQTIARLAYIDWNILYKPGISIRGGTRYFYPPKMVFDTLWF